MEQSVSSGVIASDPGFDDLIRLRGLVGLGLGLFEIATPATIIAADALDQDAEPLVRVAGAHKAIIGAGLLAADDARPWLAAALAGSAYDGLALIAKHAKPAAYVRLAAVAAIDLALLARARRADAAGNVAGL
ncbi:hypothetical protein [Terricaulis sp.]|uniref:hypothetical protein n=1 Tax=Terricaulis sp. TaxID=2768686 RepID=UPI002AC569C0|nr:hypothetical protein [Terricaulis sp.]MDZ4690267.1 hypothetical protein [Terricaulis sp.]